MNTLEEIKQILSKNKPIFKKKFNANSMAIFGSYIRGNYKKNSDIDILVEFYKPIGFFTFMDLEEYLEKLLGIKVDLVSKKALKPRVGEQILREMITIW